MPAAAVVLHIPHAARRIPPKVRRTLLPDDAELERELLRVTDVHVDELFPPASAGMRRVVYPVSRLVVDPVRCRDDAGEPMAARGMGAVYTRTSLGAPLRPPLDPAEREALLVEWYDAHHRFLGAAVEQALAARGECLVVHCHSFASTPLPCDLDQAPDRPDVCIGIDRVHTPARLAEAAVAGFLNEGFRVAVDRPHAGALVPGPWQGRDARVRSVTVALDRALYMNEATGERLPAFGVVAAAVGRVLRAVVAEPAGPRWVRRVRRSSGHRREVPRSG